MNKHIHRLVFDRRRGMRVPAADHARSAGKAAGGQSRAVAVAGAVSMLMSGAGQAQMAGASASSISAMSSSSKLSVSAMPKAMSATRSVADMVSQVLDSGRPNLPVYSIAYKGDNSGQFDDPTTSADGYVMTLLQKSGAIIVNWDSFDIGKGYKVVFDQPKGGRALNKVRGAGTSLIDGALEGNGEVMLENGAGIIFGKNARVNTGSLIATALSIAKDATGGLDENGKFKNADDPLSLNLYQWRDGRAVFSGADTSTAGFVATEAGAVIQSKLGGRVIMVAPRVVNQGLIESPSGQTILAAGQRVYLYAPTDAAQRGLLVAVDNFSDAVLNQVKADVVTASAAGETGLNTDAMPLGTVENVRQGGVYTSGLIRADKGTINLVGAALRQKGQLTATTAVKGQNGAIFLRAMTDTFSGNDGNGGTPRDAKTLGSIELGTGSITEVLPSAAGLVTADGQQTATQIVEAVVKGDAGVADVIVSKIGVRPNEVLRAPATIDEPKKPTVPADDASEAVKAKYQADLAQYTVLKAAFDQAELSVQRSSDTYYRSRIDIIGSDIRLRAGSRVQAPAGEVNILAADNWQSSPQRLSSENLPAVNGAPAADGSRIVMESGSVVDVSGLDNLLLPAQRNQLSAQLFSIELADSPVQRTGVVYRQTVMADARRLVSLGDVSGYYSNLRYTAAELSTSGGLLRMFAQGALLQDKGALVDFSGGAVTYDAGALVSSVLLRNGLITLAENAKASVRYDTFISNPGSTSADDLARYGLSGLTLPTPTVLPGQFVGKSAGVAMVGAFTQSLGATYDGSVRMSAEQRNSANVAERDPGLDVMLKPGESSPTWVTADELRAADRLVRLPQLLTSEAGEDAKNYQPNLFATLRPTAGLLVVGREVGSASNLVSSVQIGSTAPSLPIIQSSWTSEQWAELLQQLGTSTVLSTGQIQQAGLAGLTVFTDNFKFGDTATQDAPFLQLAAGGSFAAKVRLGDVSLHGSLVVPGGSITVQALAGNLTLTSGSRLDAGGTRRDDRVAGLQTPAAAMKGGSVKLTAQNDVVLAEGSEVDVSGAAWRGSNGVLTQGDAGTISLKVNDGRDGLASALPDGALKLNGTLTGFDFTGGGTLSLEGLTNVVVGGTRAGAFGIGPNLFADRGFGKLTVSALGDIDVLANAQIKPTLVNMLALPATSSAITGGTYVTGVLEEGLRSGLSLSLSAKTEPNAKVQNGMPEGSDLTVGKGSLIDMGLGGSVTLNAGGSIDMQGTLRALGGKVSLGLLGARGILPNTGTDSESFGYLAGQSIHLGNGSLIDVSGAEKSVERRSALATLQGLAQPRVGEVLAGGTVTLGGVDGTAVRGQLLMDVGASIKLNGASALLSRDLSGAPSVISSSAGTLNIMSTDGFSLLGTIEAKAPDASVAGGTLNVALSREGQVDISPINAYPSGDKAGLRTIRITDTQASAVTLDSTDRRFGEGVMSAGLVNSAGFDRVQLRADESIQLNAGVNLKADEGRTRLQSLVLSAPVIEATNRFKTTIESTEAGMKAVVGDEAASGSAKTAPDHIIQAHHVAMGPVTSNGGTVGTVAASQRTLTGSRSLEVQAGLIEVNGDTAVQGVNQINFNATLGRSAGTTLDRRNGEIRFIGQRPLTAAIDGDRQLRGQFSFNGALTLTGGQVYATTLSDYTVKGVTGSTLNVLAPADGSTSQTPLSALAALHLNASTVNIDGVIRQPVGTIDVTAGTLTMGDRASLSVSSDGVSVPVGSVLNNTQWLYSPQGSVTDSVPDVGNVVQDISKLPITKQIKLNGSTLSLSKTSTLEAQAGGDIVAWQFNKGVGGSTDTYLRNGLFAVLPNYSYDFAPFDSEIRARTQQIKTDLKVGDQVTITTANNVLAAGTYTLLDARYGILPGAVLVSATTLNTRSAMPVAVQNDDGSVQVSGFRTATGTSQTGGNDQRQALLLEPEATYRKKSDITVVSGNAYQNALATSSGQFLTRPGDGGTTSIASDQAFDWQARFNFKGKDGLNAGSFDLVMPDIVVRRDATHATASGVTLSGAGEVSLAQLNALGAESVMLGAIRTNLSDGTISVERKASSVSFKAEVGADGQPLAGDANTLSTAGEIWAVAKNSVNVDAGLTIVSTGKDSGAARTFQVNGDGALLQVGHLANTDVVVKNATAGAAPTLKVGSNAEGAAPVTMRGASVQLDSTGSTALASSTVLDTQSLGLGAASVFVGDAAKPDANALQIQGTLLDKANQAQRLNLRANSGNMAFAQGVQLGNVATKRITLDAPQLIGVVAAGAPPQPEGQLVTQVLAQQVVLRNSSSQSAPLQDGKDQVGVGSFVVKATPVLSDGHTGGITVADSAMGQRLAFATATLQSQGDIVFSGAGSTRAQADLNLNAARVTATSDANQQVTAGNDLAIGKVEGGKSLSESLGAGGKLRLEGRVLTQSGNIDIEAGRLNLASRGGVDAQGNALTETLVFAAGSSTNVAGRTRTVSDTYAVSSGGGKLSAEAQQGAIRVDGALSAAAPVLATGVSGDNTSAGTVSLKAVGAQGGVLVGRQASIDLSAAQGKAGTLQVDAASLGLTQAAAQAVSDARTAAEAAGATEAAKATYAALAKTGLDKLIGVSNYKNAVASGGTVSDTELANTDASRIGLAKVDVRLRNGTLELNSQVKAAVVALTADKASLTLNSKAGIDATTAAGGVVQLQARDDLVLNDGVNIQARSTRDGANGGDVLLASSEGKVKLGQATVVADSEGDAKDGRIVIRALQTKNAAGNYAGMNVEALAGSQAANLKAGRVQLDAVRVYSDAAKTSLVSGSGSSTAWGMTGTGGLGTDATSFATSANQAAILTKAGLSSTANTGVRAEAEIRLVDAAKAFTISNDLQLAAAAGTAGAQPMNLTVRAAGDLNVNGSVSAGLSNVTTTATVQAGEGASLRFVAGADMASANVNATLADASKGHFTLASGKLIRTTTGSVDVNASGDVRLMAATIATPSAIYVTGGLSALSANEVLAVLNTATSKTNASNAYKAAVFTERGERLSVAAGGNVGSFAAVTTSNGVIKYTQQVLTQGTGNYFYHGGNPGGAATSQVPVAWWAGFNEFRQGFGSFGGGNTDISAGGSISNVAVVAPTNARNVLQLDASGNVKGNALKVLNGGDVNVTAGGDIAGGVYFLGRGEGHLTAGGSLVTGADALGGAKPGFTDVSKPGAMLALMDGRWSVSALGDVTVSHVFNPTAVPLPYTGTIANTFNNSTTNLASTASGLTSSTASLFYTYADTAGVSLSSLQGNVNLAPNAQNFNRMMANSPVGSLDLTLTTGAGKNASVPASMLPPVVSLVSYAGNVTIDTAGTATFDKVSQQPRVDGSNGQSGSALYVMPSAASDVNVYAAENLRVRANLQVLDTQQVSSGLPSASAPLPFVSNVSGASTFATLLTSLTSANAVSTKLYDTPSPTNGVLAKSPISDLGQSNNTNLVRFIAGNDVTFADTNDAGRTVQSFLRSARPMDIVAGRDIVNPNVLGQNFDDADVTRLSAGRDIVGTSTSTLTPRTVALGGPGQFKVEAGRDLNLNLLSGVYAIGNLVNKALPEASAKITVASGTAKSVNLSELLARHGSQSGLRATVNQALSDSGLPVPDGATSWAALTDEQAYAAFSELSQARQVQSVQTFLDATFAAQYLPEDANRSAVYYRSEAFQRKKQEAMWAQITQYANAALAIAVSTDSAEEARRAQRRKDLFAAAEVVADLAGQGKTFDREGNINLGRSRVHNLGQGGGSTLGGADNSLGGIDVLAAGQVLAGLPTASNNPGGFINFDGGSFRSISGGDFLAGDQKVIALGRGNLLIYSVYGSIDSGKGSNTATASDVPVRVFNKLTGAVETQGQAPTSGSGFQKLQTPSDMTPVIGLYAPNGEIRALDAFIKGDANISILAPKVVGADNIAGASGVAAPPAPTVSLSLTPKMNDTAAGVTQVAQAADNKSKQASNSVLTVDLLGFGDQGAATAAGDVAAPVKDKADTKPEDKSKDKRQTP